MKSEVTTVKAQRSIDDINENEAKEKTRFPDKNVIDAKLRNPDLTFFLSSLVQLMLQI